MKNSAEDDFDDRYDSMLKIFPEFCGLELVQSIQTHSNLNMQNLETRPNFPTSIVTGRFSGDGVTFL